MPRHEAQEHYGCLLFAVMKTGTQLLALLPNLMATLTHAR
jgi:hypothetical protein